MLTYHEGALSGFEAYAATSPRGRRITMSVETSTAMCTSPRLPSRGQRHLDHRSRLHGLPSGHGFTCSRAAAVWWTPLSGRARRLRCGPGPRLDAVQRLGKSLFGHLGVVGGLRPQPVAVGQAEETAQPQIGVCGHGALAGDDLADA